MAVTAQDRLTGKTQAMADAIYAALDAIDAYRDETAAIAAEQEASGEPNAMLVKRMGQFVSRAETMVRIIEDQVLDHLNFCTDRLFSVGPSEQGEFI